MGVRVLSYVDALLTGPYGTLKVRLALVVVLAVLIPITYATVQSVLEARRSAQRSLETLHSVLQLVDSQHRDALKERVKLLQSLAENASVVAGGAPCRQILANEAEQNTGIAVISLANTAGIVTCSSKPTLEGIDIADRYWFTRSLQVPRWPVLDALRQSRDAEVGGVIALAMSVAVGNSTPSGVLVIALMPDSLVRLAPNLALPEDATTAILDRNGTALAARGRADHLKSLMALLHSGVIAFDGQAHIGESEDGRSWATLAMASPDEALGTSLVVGLPYSAWSWLDTRFLTVVLVPALILILIALFVWGALDALVTRPVVKLIAAVRNGRDRGAPLAAGLTHAPTDLLELATAFDKVSKESRDREVALQSALAERNLLIKEIHHRVKNNLQVVTSLLNLRSARLVNREAADAMREAQLRIKSLAVVHRLIYELDEFGDIALDELLSELSTLMQEASAGFADDVTRILELEHVSVLADQTTPIALIVTELLSNCTKHAFPDGRAGTIVVKLRAPSSDDARAVLSIGDDGVGFGPDNRDDSPGGMGRTLVAMLARQLGGQLEVKTTERGTLVELSFVPSTTRVEGEAGPATNSTLRDAPVEDRDTGSSMPRPSGSMPQGAEP